MLSFAIMMLHTSLHNPTVQHRTTTKQWVSMNRGESFPYSLSENMGMNLIMRQVAVCVGVSVYQLLVMAVIIITYDFLLLRPQDVMMVITFLSPSFWISMPE